MVSAGESRKCRKMLSVILQERHVSSFDLIDMAHMSISSYNTLRPYFIDRYAERVRYDKQTKTWSAIEEEITEEQKMLEPKVREGGR